MKRFTNSRHRQKGISSFGWIAVFGIFAILLLMFFKVFPMFLINFQVQSALEGLQQDGGVDPKSKRAIWTSLQKRLYINEIRNITRENIVMERKDGKTTVTVTWEAKDSFIGNLFIGANFVESIVIDR
jgi:hypothetical protein